MAEIKYVTDPYLSTDPLRRNLPPDTIKDGDLLIFDTLYTGKHVYWKRGGKLKYGFLFPSRRGSQGSPGPNGSDSPTQEVSALTIIPAIHIGDTTPDALSTYWLKSDGMYEKKYTAYNVFTWERI